MPGLRAQAILTQADDEASVLGRIWRVIDEQSVAEAGLYHTLDVVLSKRQLVHDGRLDPPRTNGSRSRMALPRA